LVNKSVYLFVKNKDIFNCFELEYSFDKNKSFDIIYQQKISTAKSSEMISELIHGWLIDLNHVSTNMII